VLPSIARASKGFVRASKCRVLTLAPLSCATGRVASLHWIFIPVTTAEFEGERLKSYTEGTDIVRPLMSRVGDLRDADSLLRDIAADSEKFRFKTLQQTPQGREILTIFTTVAKEKLRHVVQTGREARLAASKDADSLAQSDLASLTHRCRSYFNPFFMPAPMQKTSAKIARFLSRCPND
jgi:hypothetical protein